MSRTRTDKARIEQSLPPCYAMVHPGLEEIAGEEIEHALGGAVKRTESGLAIFRVDEITPALLTLRTTEDVFLFGWGTDQLTHRAEDLERIRRWTAREVDWAHLLRLHHAVRAPPKGKPTFRLVTQMEGQHGYLRKHAREALASGLDGKLPASWRPAEENAAVEIWLTIKDATAICGLRLSDRTMRHRPYKLEHRPASLRPTLAAAMVRLSEARLPHVILDPLCGAGTILAEYLVAKGPERGERPAVLGGDLERGAVECAAANLRRLGSFHLACWDARRVPLADASVDRILSNPPFGKQLEKPETIGPLYRAVIAECDRVLRPGGLAVLLVSESDVLREAVRPVGWGLRKSVRVRILGQKATLTVWRKG